MNKYCEYIRSCTLKDEIKERVFQRMQEKAARQRAGNAPAPSDRTSGKRRIRFNPVRLPTAAALVLCVLLSAAILPRVVRDTAEIPGSTDSWVSENNTEENCGEEADTMDFGIPCVIEYNGVKYVIADYRAQTGGQDSYLTDLAAVMIRESDEENYLSEGLAYPYITVDDCLYNYYDENNRFYLYGFMDYKIEEVLGVRDRVESKDCSSWYINAEKYVNGELDGERWSVSAGTLEYLFNSENLRK